MMKYPLNRFLNYGFLVHLLILLVITLNFNKANAQNRLLLKGSPLSLLDPYTPTFQFGMEYQFLKRWAFEIDYGIKSPAPWNNEKHNEKYFKLKSEGRVYWHLRKNKWFAGIAGYYLPDSYHHINGILATNTTIYGYQEADVRRDVSVGLLKIGHVIGISKRWSVELCGGIGFRLIYTQHTNIVGLGAYNDPGDYVSILPDLSYDYDPEEGQTTKPHVELGIKFSYLIFSGKK